MQGTYRVVSLALTALTCGLEPKLLLVGLKGSSGGGLVACRTLAVVVASAGPVVPSELLVAVASAAG